MKSYNNVVKQNLMIMNMILGTSLDRKFKVLASRCDMLHNHSHKIFLLFFAATLDPIV